jgi:hypothetical protein
MHQNIIGRSAASKMTFGDLLYFNEAQEYPLFPRSYRDSCCFQGARRENCSFSRKIDGYLLFP